MRYQIVVGYKGGICFRYIFKGKDLINQSSQRGTLENRDILKLKLLKEALLWLNTNESGDDDSIVEIVMNASNIINYVSGKTIPPMVLIKDVHCCTLALSRLKFKYKFRYVSNLNYTPEVAEEEVGDILSIFATMEE